MRRDWVWVCTIGRVPEPYRSTGMQGEWCSVYIRRYTAFVFTAIVNHIWSRSQEPQAWQTDIKSDYNSAEEIKTGQLNWHSVVLDIHVHQGSSAFFL